MCKCPYCGTDNVDGGIFCEECGRPMKKPELKKKEQKNYCTEENGKFIYVSEKQVTVQDGMEEVLKFPDAQVYTDGNWVFTYKEKPGKNLYEYLEDKKDSLPQVYIEIENRILAIFEKVQKEKYIVGSCNLEDFYLMDNEPSKMILRVVRPLLSEGVITEGYEPGEFAAPEVRNKNAQYIGKKTDVYLAAIIFNRMIIGGRYSAGNIDSQLFWGYNCTNAAFHSEGKKYRRFHHWLGSTLSMYPAKRMKHIRDCRINFEKSCSLEQGRLIEDLTLEDVLQTNVGKGKKAFMVNAGRREQEWNEDAIEKWGTADRKLTAYLLADGISNCDVGSGYFASNIIRKNFKAVLSENIRDEFVDLTYDMVEDTVYEIVRRSNRDIWKKACEYPVRNGNIMGSTLIFIMIYDGAMYTYSLGDSLLYLIRNGNVIPINSPDTVGFAALRRGMSYTGYRQMEGKDGIALYVGGDFARIESDYYKQREVEIMCLQREDIIIAASDGVMDYLGAKLSETNWDRERVLAEQLMKKEPLEMRARHIISRDNKNGGGDNLSIILIKAGGESHE